MTAIFRSSKTLKTLHVTGVTSISYTIYTDDTTDTIDDIRLADHIWRCEHRGSTIFKPDTRMSFALPASSWNLISVSDSDILFSVKTGYVKLSADGVSMSPDLPSRKGGDTQ